MVLFLLLIGQKSGANFLSQQHSALAGAHRINSINTCSVLLETFKFLIIISSFVHVGGAVASWLVCLTLEQVFSVRAMAGDIVLCS